MEPGQTLTLADISGSGAIQHIWMTPTGDWRLSILRMYWDGETDPSVEVPVGDFFAMGWDKYAPISSLAVCVNPGSAFNSTGPCLSANRRLTSRISGTINRWLPTTQFDYAKAPVPADAAYFPAQFAKSNLFWYKQIPFRH